jgi:hypothetical protein
MPRTLENRMKQAAVPTTGKYCLDRVEIPDENLEERAQRELVIGDDRLLVVADVFLHLEGQGHKDEHHEQARDERLGAMGVHRLLADKGQPEVVHVLPEGGEHGDQIAEERRVLGHCRGDGQ